MGNLMGDSLGGNVFSEVLLDLWMLVSTPLRLEYPKKSSTKDKKSQQWRGHKQQYRKIDERKSCKNIRRAMWYCTLWSLEVIEINSHGVLTILSSNLSSCGNLFDGFELTCYSIWSEGCVKAPGDFWRLCQYLFRKGRARKIVINTILQPQKK